MPEDKKEATVEVELLADGIRVDGVDYVRGDVVTLPKSHAERLRKYGSVGDKGSVEKARKAAQERDEAEARHQRYLTGLGDLDETEATDEPASSPKPGPRSTGSK